MTSDITGNMSFSMLECRITGSSSNATHVVPIASQIHVAL